ncbi:MAG: histidinol-phosphate transaminase [Gallionellales bacterium RIFCSPLOWO2_02_FULL_57_47]|nr:MAG: histidinol-phosphate transaminase [Gallionellales bacterium RIFCSPLOWO2_02_FULL_57_47]OGT18063.1 MAG: histidinol-phosphate transaminase [Gallionellales bacterium RIFCSPHIGHO2_02_FULL_57_16]
MNYSDLAPPYIRAIAPYQPGKPISELERELGITGIVKLASNENPLGASPQAVAAARAMLEEIALYPDGNGFALKDALAQRYGVAHGQIVLGNGSNDMLELAARAFLTVGDKAVYSAHAFAVYPLATQAVGATGVSVSAVNFGHDLKAMLQAAVGQQAKLVFIANPNNPTGTFLSAAALMDFLRALPSNILVVLDEAYNEYLPEECRYDSVAWLKEFPNLIISRTFSKAYGLAGLRVGYAFAHVQVADMMNRVRQPFNVNSVAQAAAVAALQDEDFVRQTNELNRRGMAQITGELSRLGLEYIPSFGNFVSFKISEPAAGSLLRVAKGENQQAVVGHPLPATSHKPMQALSHGEGAMHVYRRLLELGVIVRPIANYDMPGWLRVSIGLETENDKFLSALKRILGEQ